MVTQSLLNKDIFVRDPTAWTIPNLGVAKVGQPERPEEWEVLRYELTSFVCAGEYERGLERILNTFLAHLNQPEQPAVWISGFYGSGKSHLARVLEALWRNTEFPDGARARSLVRVTPEIDAHLRELETAGRRVGGLWSAAGMLGAGVGASVRLALLSILFRAAGLPSQYDRARFLLWLRRRGYEPAVRAQLAERGYIFEEELPHLAVSTALAEAVLAAEPALANTPQEVLQLLATQFSAPSDITDDDLIETIDEVLALQSTAPNKRPLTLLILDELQQYLGEDQRRTLQVQQVVEACSARFGSAVLFVGTGQAALQANPQLQKLQARFTVRVTLEDRDIEQVVREVVLRKKPEAKPTIEAEIDRAKGEISRHLSGSSIGARHDDDNDLVPDYPLLPTRRRFWEAVLRAVDLTGTSAQLRTQLRIVQEATRAVAGLPLGHVIGADVIYDQLKTEMLQSGVLPREFHHMIAELDDGTEDGRLRSRLCSLIFLISKLPTTGPAATGLRATADTLADLVVTDLLEGSAELRRRIPELLADLVEQGRLLQIDGEYGLQTKEGTEWEQAFRERYQRLVNDDARIAEERVAVLRTALEEVLRGITLTHGQSRAPRKLALHYGPHQPKEDTGAVPIWVRDEWDVSERTVREDARAAGDESPVVFVILPRRDAETLKTVIARRIAAQETLETRPDPATDEGRQARDAMRSRLEGEQARLSRLVEAILHEGSVFQGGGNEVVGDSLRASILAAAEASLTRLFPKFALGDHPNWGQVMNRAQEGNSGALELVGHRGEVADHPACKEILAFVGGSSKKGSEIRKRFMGSPYGWPQDAVDGVLHVLTATGLVRASRGGVPLAVRELGRQQVPGTDFAGEEITITKGQWIALRALLTHLGYSVSTDEEARSTIPQMLRNLAELAEKAGGEPPLPLRPSIEHIRDLLSRAGNEQVQAVWELRDRLRDEFLDWSRARALIEVRLPRWQHFQQVLGHARSLPIAGEVEPQVAAILEHRALLADPDPLPPLYEQVTRALREALQAARDRLISERERVLADLERTQEWGQLTEPDRQRILQQFELGPVPDLDVGTDEALLRTLNTHSLKDWEDRVVALPARVDLAREEAARLLMPKAVRVHRRAATLQTVAEVDAYLAELRSEIMRHIEAGHPVLV